MFHVKQSPLLAITLPDVCPPSWNKFYAGIHWSERKRIADEAHMLIRCYLPHDWQPITVPVAIRYDAYQVRPLDADNIASKLYTDGLVRAGVLGGDDWQHVQAVTTATHKAKTNYLTITIIKASLKRGGKIMSKPKTAMVPVRMEPSLFHALKEFARVRETTVSDVIRRAVISFLDDEKFEIDDDVDDLPT